MKQKKCPLLKKPCIGEDCSFWVKIWGIPPGATEPVLDEECAIVWSVLLQRETLVETARSSASYDKVANQANKLAFAITEVAVEKHET